MGHPYSVVGYIFERKCSGGAEPVSTDHHDAPGSKTSHHTAGECRSRPCLSANFLRVRHDLTCLRLFVFSPSFRPFAAASLQRGVATAILEAQRRAAQTKAVTTSNSTSCPGSGQ